MLRFEDYVSKRKKEDQLNEFDLNARAENMRTLVNYVFEYFNNYLDINVADEKTVLENERIDKYRKQIEEYDPEIREWLTNIYSEHGHFLNKILGGMVKDNEYFFLLTTDQEFRSLSYDIYAKLIKKHPYLRDQTEMFFLLIKNYHRLQREGPSWLQLPPISDDIDSWIADTWDKYNVNLKLFASNWVQYFYNHEELWPATHRIKNQEGWRDWDYNYRMETNLFNLNTLYAKMPKKPFTRGKKQEFEIILMYYWVHEVDGEKDYWQEYLGRVLPKMR